MPFAAPKGIRSIVVRALKLRPRGAVPNDSLALLNITGQLQLQWQARDAPPWDRDLSLCRQAELSHNQALEDAEAAIRRLFQMLPEIGHIEIRVFHPREPDKVILHGAVDREDVLNCDSLPSVRMRLLRTGVRFSAVGDDHVEAMPERTLTLHSSLKARTNWWGS